MLRAIDEAGRNYLLARQIYRDRIRNNGRSLTSRRNFQRIDQKFSDEESVLRHISTHRGPGRPRVHWRKEKQVIALARIYPLMDLRNIAQQVRISHETVRRIICEEGLRV